MAAGIALRVWVSALLLLLSAVATLLPAGGWSTPTLVLCATLLLSTAAAGRRMSLVFAVPVSMTALIVIHVTGGLLMNWLPTGWASRPVSVAVWWAVLVGACATSWMRRREVFRPIGPDAPVGAAGLAMLVGFGALALLQPSEVWLRHVALGTDFARHVAIMGGTVASGGLDLGNGAGYPRGVHALVGVAWRAGGGTEFVSAWNALQGFLVLMLAGMTMGLVAAARSWSTALDLKALWGTWLVPIGIGVAVIQGMWLSTMMASGFVVSVAAGLTLAAMMSVISVPDSWPTTWLVGLLTVNTVAMAYSWPILVLVPGVVAAVAWSASRFRVSGAIFLVVGAVVAVAPIVALGTLTASSADYRQQIVANTAVLLWWPEWWWLLLTALAVVLSVLLWRIGPANAVALLIAWACAAITIGAVAILTGTTASTPGYYLLKTLWSASNLVLPAGLVGGAWGVAALWGRGKSVRAPWGTAMKSAAVLFVGLLAAAALGRLTANAQTWSNVTKGFGEVPLTYVAVEYLERHNILPDSGQAVAVWGLSPYASLNSVQNAGMQDRYVGDAVRWLQADIIRPEVPVTVGRNAADMCRFLAENPSALRITGPNEGSGVGWLTAAGCPESVVRPGEWIRVPIGDQWFVHLSMEGQPYAYPDWEEYRDQMRRRDPDWGTYRIDGAD